LKKNFKKENEIQDGYRLWSQLSPKTIHSG